jgi:pyruvate,orthophosphate dikinase
VKQDPDLNEAALREVVARFKKVVQAKTKKPFPQDPHDQLRLSRDAVFRSWQNPRAKEYRRIYDIPDHIGTAVNVQMMVFGNTGDRSGTGVGFTRSPATGAKEFYGEFLINAQGEDVVAGIRTPRPIRDLETVMPHSYKQLRLITTRLEKHYKDVQDFEFTIQDERLFMLQTRSGKRTGYAAVVIATDLVAEKLVSPKEAILLVDPEALNQLLAPGFEPAEWKKIPTATRGLPASPGAASGQVVFSADDAVQWTQQGKPGDVLFRLDVNRITPEHFTRLKTVTLGTVTNVAGLGDEAFFSTFTQGRTTLTTLNVKKGNAAVTIRVSGGTKPAEEYQGKEKAVALALLSQL